MPTIGFFSASTPITALSPQRFARAQVYLRSKGYSLIPGDLTGRQDAYRSGSVQARAAELNQLIHNDQIDIIMSTIGGNDANAVLPYLDYTYLRAHPKKFIGFSDTTALLMAVMAQTNSQVFYGPALVASFGEFSPYVDETYAYFAAVTAMQQSALNLPAPKYWTDEALNWEIFQKPKERRPNAWGWRNQSRLTGRLIGGNLNTLDGIWGTPYMPDIQRGDLLLIEDAEKDAATIERSFAHLALAGIFDQVSGIVLGKHALFNNQGSGKRPVDILTEILGERQVPVVFDFDASHTVPMMTMPLGQVMTIDAVAQTVSIRPTSA